MNKTPIYKYPSDFARENGEMEQFQASRKANIVCKEAIEAAIRDNHDGLHFDSHAVVREVMKQFSYERVFYVLAATIVAKEWDERFSKANKAWARTVPLFAEPENIRHNPAFVVNSHPCLTDAFIEAARHEYLLSLPLKREDIQAEAKRILAEFQNANEPNSPNGTHYMAQVSPDFLARANTKDHDRLMDMLPFQTLTISTLNDRKGTFALIRRDENRFRPLRLRKPSARKKLQEQPDAPKSPGKGKPNEQER